MERWIRIIAAAAVLGGVAWLLKVVALVLQGGEATPVDATLFAVGGLLLLIGSVGVGLSLTQGRPRAWMLAAGIAAPFVFVLAFVLLTMATEALFGSGTLAGGEGGIVIMAIAEAAFGALISRRGSKRRAEVRV